MLYLDVLLAIWEKGWYNIKSFVEILEQVNRWLWGGPILLMILGTGIWITLRCRAPQFRFFPASFRAFVRSFFNRGEDHGGASPFRALCTALAATVGTGNIAGVAGAIAIGGPGAIFWMWVSAVLGMATKFAESTLAVRFRQRGRRNIAGVAGAIAIGGPGAIFWMWVSAVLGMATKFAESTLAVRFRQRGRNGEWIGGPMYMIRNGLPKRFHPLATGYAILGLAAAFGVGNATQVNAVICAMEETARGYGMGQHPATAYLAGGLIAVAVVVLVSGGAGKIGRITEGMIPVVAGGYILLCCIAIGRQHRQIPTALAAILSGGLIAVAVVVLVSGGAGKIGRITEGMIPVVAGGYILLCCIAIGRQHRQIPTALAAILSGAFEPRAVSGGMVGSGFAALRIGVSRGTFTNEAGMGTAAMAHGSALVEHPVEQGFMGIMEVFVDTIVICTLTALVILTSGIPIPYGSAAGSELTARALSASFGPWVSAFLCGCLCFFAVGTILGWGLYAGRCAEFLFGSIRWGWFALCQGICVMIGVILNTGTVWTLSELTNGLMALPNLVALAALMPWGWFALCQGICVMIGVILNTGTVWTLSELTNGLMALPNLVALAALMPELARLIRQYQER